MGFGSANATKGKTGFRLDTKRNIATAQRIWARLPDNLAAVASRFAGVLFENRSAIQCIRDNNTVSTLHLSPPTTYMKPASRRQKTAHRMSVAQQRCVRGIN